MEKTHIIPEAQENSSGHPNKCPICLLMPEITFQVSFLSPKHLVPVKCKSSGHDNSVSCCYIPVRKKRFFRDFFLKQIGTRREYVTTGPWKGVEQYNLNG